MKTYVEFFDMHSGGSQKTEYASIFIEGNEEEAADKFLEVFEFSPYEVSCECCGEDYSIRVLTEQEFESSVYACQKGKTSIKIIEK